jgi:putative membrane fusion protein
MKVFRRIIVTLFILSLLALYVVIYAIPGFFGAFTKTEILRYGNIRIEDHVTCYFIRDEKVYLAERPGNVVYYIGDSVHIKSGARVLSVGNTSYISEINGITSYFFDGYEEYFTPDTMKSLKYGDVSALDFTLSSVVKEEALADEPLFKICNNREWHIAFWIGAAHISKYDRNNRVTVELPLGQIEAKVRDIIEDGDKWLIILKTDRYYEEFTKARAVDAVVVSSDSSGIIIRNESLSFSDGVVGVYIKAKNGTFVFKPVRIITTDGKNSIVEVSYYYDDQGEKVGTVNIYDEILLNPSGTERGAI